MNLPVNPNHLAAIKTLTLCVANIKDLREADCRRLSFLIIEKTSTGISETTIKRIFGFLISRFQPSMPSLHTLAVYCGYHDWDDFCRLQPVHQQADGSGRNCLFHPLVSILMDMAAPTVILNTNAPAFTIVNYNNAYAEATLTKGIDLRGQTLWNAFNCGGGGRDWQVLLLEAFYEAIQNRQTVVMPPLRYDLPSRLPDVHELSWWDVKVDPVIDNGFVKWIVLRVNNITDKVLPRDDIENAIMKELTMVEDLAVANIKLKHAINNLAESHRELKLAKSQLEVLNKDLEQCVWERTRELLESEIRQRALVDNAPVAIAVLNGPDHLIETANKTIISYWGKTPKVVGQPLAEALPELEGQPFISILNEVRRSGIPYINPELHALIKLNGVVHSRYFDMIYQPVRLKQGVADMIYIVAVDITDHVLMRKRAEELGLMLQVRVSRAD
jgi:PAS domain-containing protein